MDAGQPSVAAFDERVAAPDPPGDAGRTCVAAFDGGIAAGDEDADARHPCIAVRDGRGDAERPPVAAHDECVAALNDRLVGFAALWQFPPCCKSDACTVDEVVQGSFWQ